MTRDKYLDMCLELGTEPLEHEIPVELDDFALEAQHCLLIYKTLRDEWDYMNGNYIGKNLSGIFQLFEVYEIDRQDWKFYLEIIHLIDQVRIEQIRLYEQQKPAK
jgi:hypothetical protein